MTVDLALFTYHQALKNVRDNLQQLAAAFQIADAALEELGTREPDPLTVQLLGECGKLTVSVLGDGKCTAAVLTTVLDSMRKEASDGTAP